MYFLHSTTGIEVPTFAFKHKSLKYWEKKHGLEHIKQLSAVRLSMKAMQHDRKLLHNYYIDVILNLFDKFGVQDQN